MFFHLCYFFQLAYKDIFILLYHLAFSMTKKGYQGKELYVIYIWGWTKEHQPKNKSSRRVRLHIRAVTYLFLVVTVLTLEYFFKLGFSFIKNFNQVLETTWAEGTPTWPCRFRFTNLRLLCLGGVPEELTVNPAEKHYKCNGTSSTTDYIQAPEALERKPSVIDLVVLRRASIVR